MGSRMRMGRVALAQLAARARCLGGARRDAPALAATGPAIEPPPDECRTRARQPGAGPGRRGLRRSSRGRPSARASPPASDGGLERPVHRVGAPQRPGGDARRRLRSFAAARPASRLRPIRLTGSSTCGLPRSTAIASSTSTPSAPRRPRRRRRRGGDLGARRARRPRSGRVPAALRGARAVRARRPRRRCRARARRVLTLGAGHATRCRSGSTARTSAGGTSSRPSSSAPWLHQVGARECVLAGDPLMPAEVRARMARLGPDAHIELPRDPRPGRGPARAAPARAGGARRRR